MTRLSFRRITTLLVLGGASACTSVLGVDFEGRLAPSLDHGDGSIEDAGAPENDATDGAATSLCDPAWTRWPVASQFPSNQTTSVGDDGTFSDRVTGLVWAHEALPTALQWDEAVAACTSSRLGGFDDWRLPTRIELLSLVNYFFYPAVSADILPAFTEEWTSSTFAEDTTRAWVVRFNLGSVIGNPKSEALRARCVRAGNVTDNRPPARFVATAFGTVFDKQTSLTWQAAPGTARTYAEASIYCQSLVLGGVSGFHLPTLHELHSIVDERRVDPALDPLFLLGGLTWSKTGKAATTAEDNTTWTLDEYDGHTVSREVSSKAAPRCVK